MRDNFNAKDVLAALFLSTQGWFEENAPAAKAVIGISGGKDSAVAAAILARALGKDRVIGVMMPCGEQVDIDDSKRVIDALGIKGVEINIAGAFNSFVNEMDNSSYEILQDAAINLQPRLRMAALYMVAQSCPHGGIVINTCNYSEDYVGYATKFGDCAGDVSILGDLLVSEIVALGDEMEELPTDIVHKVPSDGLWGDSDEDRLGFTYEELERYILGDLDLPKEVEEKIQRMHTASRHKYNPIPVLYPFID